MLSKLFMVFASTKLQGKVNFCGIKIQGSVFAKDFSLSLPLFTDSLVCLCQ